MREQVCWVIDSRDSVNLYIKILHDLLGPQLLNREVLHFSNSMSQQHPAAGARVGAQPQRGDDSQDLADQVGETEQLTEALDARVKLGLGARQRDVGLRLGPMHDRGAAVDFRESTSPAQSLSVQATSS